MRDYADRFDEGGAQMAAWIADGRMRIDEHVVAGIDQAYDAFMMLFHGTNNGKMVLKLI